MKGALLFISGIVTTTLFFAALWGGAWLMEEFPPDHWASFPSFTTAFILGIASLAGACHSWIEFGFWVVEETKRPRVVWPEEKKKIA